MRKGAPLTEPTSLWVLLVVELTVLSGRCARLSTGWWPGAMSSVFDRCGAARQIEHLSRPLDLPVLAVGGERAFGPTVAENLRHGAPDIRQEVLADCRHLFSEEPPAELADLLLSFFDNM